MESKVAVQTTIERTKVSGGRTFITDVYRDDFGSLVVMLPAGDWVEGSLVRVELLELPRRKSPRDKLRSLPERAK